MFGLPLDAWYVWIGLSLASLVAVGAVGSLPTTPPPDAAGAATTVDTVAVADGHATGEHPLDADAVRVTPHGIDLRNDAGTAHATFAYGPVTPVAEGSALQDVLYGTPPATAFDSRRALVESVVEARSRDPTWEPADRTLVVAHVSFEGYDVTLVDV